MGFLIQPRNRDREIWSIHSILQCYCMRSALCLEFGVLFLPVPPFFSFLPCSCCAHPLRLSPLIAGQESVYNFCPCEGLSILISEYPVLASIIIFFHLIRCLFPYLVSLLSVNNTNRVSFSFSHFCMSSLWNSIWPSLGHTMRWNREPRFSFIYFRLEWKSIF